MKRRIAALTPTIRRRAPGPAREEASHRRDNADHECIPSPEVLERVLECLAYGAGRGRGLLGPVLVLAVRGQDQHPSVPLPARTAHALHHADGGGDGLEEHDEVHLGA